jgi:hypothetical protein
VPAERRGPRLLEIGATTSPRRRGSGGGGGTGTAAAACKIHAQGKKRGDREKQKKKKTKTKYKTIRETNVEHFLDSFSTFPTYQARKTT